MNKIAKTGFGLLNLIFHPVKNTFDAVWIEILSCPEVGICDESNDTSHHITPSGWFQNRENSRKRVEKLTLTSYWIISKRAISKQSKQRIECLRVFCFHALFVHYFVKNYSWSYILHFYARSIVLVEEHFQQVSHAVLVFDLGVGLEAVAGYDCFHYLWYVLLPNVLELADLIYKISRAVYTGLESVI